MLFKLNFVDALENCIFKKNIYIADESKLLFRLLEARETERAEARRLEDEEKRLQEEKVVKYYVSNEKENFFVCSLKN